METNLLVLKLRCRRVAWWIHLQGDYEFGSDVAPVTRPGREYDGDDGTWRSLVSALVWGTRGRRFKSGRPDFFIHPGTETS